MAATREKIGVEMLVQPKLDPRAASKVVRDTASLHKKLSTLKLDWAEIAKQSRKNVSELNSIATASEAYAKSLSKTAKSSIRDLVGMGEELSELHDKAEQLRDELSRTKSPGQRKALAGDLSSVSKSIVGLNKQINLHKGIDKKQLSELKGVVRAQRNYRMGLETAAKYGGKDFLKDVADSVGRGNVLGTVGGVGKAVGKAAHGAAARGALAEGGAAAGLGGPGGGGLNSAIIGISKVIPVVAGFATAMAGLWKFIAAASEHQTKLNKALLEGTGTAGDFFKNVDTYKSTLSDLRGAVVDTSGSFLKLGIDSEARLKIISKYAQESTGSLAKTRGALADLGKGDLKKGVEQFTMSAVAYGKALGMEATDVGAMMGKFESEVGYGASQTQDLMGNIVKAAATANMPLTKFMDIFRSVTPNVELFTNRIEELTGAIKLLSKNMSPKDVKDFMDAFGKGFKGMSFKDRLGKVLVAGVGNVNNILKKDFAAKSDVMAKKFEDLSPALGGAFKEAFASGDAKKMNDVLIKAKGLGASGTDIGEAQKLMQAEMERRKGGPLSTASAMKGAGLWSTVKVMQSEMKRFGMGGRVTGINEQVAEKRGYSQDQIDAMNNLISSMNLYGQSLKDYGTTGSKSMDKALRDIIAVSKGVNVDQVTPQDMAKASEDQIAAAAEASNKDEKTAQTAEDLATEQVTATTSLSEKIDNVLGFLLEKIFNSMQSILDPLDNIWNWLSGNKGQQDTIKAIDRWNQGVQTSGYGADAKAQMQVVADAVRGGVASGLDGADLAKSLADSPAFEKLGQLDPSKIEGIARKHGVVGSEAIKMSSDFKAAMREGDQKKAMGVLGKIPGTADALMEVGQDLLKFGASGAAKDKMAGRREGTEQKKVLTRKEEKDKADAAQARDDDLVQIGEKISGVAADVSGATSDVAKTMSKAAGPSAAAPIGAASKAGPAGAGPPSKAEAESADKLETIGAGQEDAAKTSKEQLSDVYDGVNDVASILKKGIRYETTFLSGKYRNVIKEATLDSFNSALRDFAVIQAKLQTDSSFAQDLADSGKDIIESGVAMSDLGRIDPGTSTTAMADLVKKAQEPMGAMQTGGPIPDTGMYKLHKGEAVLDAATYGSVQRDMRGGGAGGGGINVNLTINAAPNWTPAQFEGAVYGAMDKAMRKH